MKLHLSKMLSQNYLKVFFAYFLALLGLTFSYYPVVSSFYTVPKTLFVNSTAYLVFSLYNPYNLTTFYDLELKFESDCISFEKDSIDVDYLNPYQSYTKSLKLNINCKPGLHFIRLKISGDYSSIKGSNSFEKDFVFPIFINSFSDVKLEVLDSNLVEEEYGYILLSLSPRDNSELSDVYLFINSSCIIPNKNPIYIDEINKNKKVWIKVYASGKVDKCLVIFNVSYTLNKDVRKFYSKSFLIDVKSRENKMYILNYSFENSTLTIYFKVPKDLRDLSIYLNSLSRNLILSKKYFYFKEVKDDVLRLKVPFYFSKKVNDVYKIFIRVFYSLGFKFYNQTFEISHKFIFRPKVDIVLESVEEDTISIKVVNLGNQPIYSILVEVYGNNISKIFPMSDYSKNIDEFDYASFTFKFTPLSDKVSFRFKVTYLDSLGNSYTIEKMFKVNVDYQEESKRGSISPYFFLLVLIIAVLFYVFRRRKKNENVEQVL